MSGSRAVLPYRVLRSDAIEPEPKGWNVVVDGVSTRTVAHGAAIPEWDAKLRFRLEREFRVEVDVAHTLGIDTDESCCELVVTASTARGADRRVLFREPVPSGSGNIIRAVVCPESTALAIDLVLTTGIYLSRNVESHDVLAPTIQGSRLCETVDRIRLEGGAARLPIYEVPFTQAFKGKRIDHADFHVEIADDLGLDIESGLTVYLNSERPDFIAEVSIPGSEAERRLWSGIMRRVLTSTLLSGAGADAEMSKEPTLGSTAFRWARQIWPEIQTENLNDLPRSDFSRYEAQIESWLRRIDSTVRVENGHQRR